MMSGLLMRTTIANAIMRSCLTGRLPRAPIVRFESDVGRGACTPKKSEKSKTKKKKRVCEENPKVNWFKIECCPDPCREAYPRFDALYYVPSDKETRKYTQTWVQCPNMKYAKKKVCCKHDCIKPKWEKRKFPKRTGLACSMHDSELLKCLEGDARCKTLYMPHCRKARKPPKCTKTRPQSDCKKICCPYPSFSECKRPKLLKGPPIECPCLRVPAMCEVYATARRLGK